MLSYYGRYAPWQRSTYSLNVIPEEAPSETSYDLIEDGQVRSESLDRRALALRPWAMPSPSVGPGLSMTESPTTPQKFASFLSRHNPLKRTKSVSKLDRKPEKRSHNESQGPVRVPLANLNNHPGMRGTTSSNIRGSRSHESLLSYSTTTHMIDLGASDAPQVLQLHPSVLGSPNCFQISTPAGATKYYQCRTPAERERWLESVRRTMYPHQEHSRRTENSLQIWLQEAKGIPAKRRYFCELCLDKTLYARTSAKAKSEICFWGEQFDFNHLPKLETVCINLYREADRKKKKDRSTLVGFVEIPVAHLTSRHPIERWYSVTGADKTTGGKGELPTIRIKARYQSVTVLPLRVYDGLLQFLQSRYLTLCLALEPALSVKAKEDFATSLVRVLHKQNLAKDYLCDLIMSEVNALDNEHLMFRGNSLATKAMEAYMKLVADHYLQETLGEFVRSVLESEDDCEVDPLKMSGSNISVLDGHQKLLTFHVEAAWGKIINSAFQFPIELRQVFEELRYRLSQTGRSELADKLISSSIFLRFLCPAILSPSLFSLVNEYPSGKGARNLTLIAKTLQTLANFTKFGGKEHYMEFMNVFVDREWDNMRQFLKRISTASPYSRREVVWEGYIDLGKELSLLQLYLVECWNSISQDQRSKFSQLEQTLESLSELNANPNAPVLPESLTPLSPISDYDNDSSPTTDCAPERLSLHSQSRTPPATDLNTLDDYVLHSALSSRYRIPRAQSTTARDAVCGRSDDLIYVDDSTLLSPEDTPEPRRADQATVSSGYVSLNQSSNSSSNSSSPVERPPKQVVKPLSIANPLYSMHTVPLAQQRAACQSLPDIQAVPEQFSLRESVLTPDSSFDDSPQQRNLNVLTTSLTPSALNSILAEKNPVAPPRTNPRYCVSRSVRTAQSTPKMLVAPLQRQETTPPDPVMVQSADNLQTPQLMHMKEKLAEANTRLKDAQNRENDWRSKYEDARPRWNEHVKPILSRLKMVEVKLQEELKGGQQKQQIIQAQQRKIDTLLYENQKLMAKLRQSNAEPLVNGCRRGDSDGDSLESLSATSSLAADA